MQTYRVSGLHSGQPYLFSVCPSRQNCQNQERMSTFAEQSHGICKDTGSYHWPVNVNHTCCVSGTLALPRSAASQVKGFAAVQSTKPRLRHHSAPQPGSTTGPNMVDRVFLSRRTASQMATANSNNRVRCIKERLGSPSNSSAADDWRSLESQRSNTPHQLVGIESCLLGSTSICSESFQCPCPPSNGQHSCYSILKSSRRNQILRSMSTSNLDLELVHPERNHNPCRSSTRPTERKSRFCFQELERQQRLDARSHSIRTTTNEIWPFFNRSLCIISKCSTPKVFQLETKPECLSGGCSSTTVGSFQDPLCLSSICSDREMLTEDTGGEGLSCTHHSSNLAGSTLVSSDHTNAGRYPLLLPNQTDLLLNPHRQYHPLIQNGHLRLGAWLVSGIPCQVASFQKNLSIYNASWRKSTAKSYDSAWNLWAGWCKQRSVNPISAPLKDIIQFLTDQFHAGKQYSTINTYRSTISSAHPPIDGVLIGKHPIVSRFMQGVFNSRPPCPKYSTTWNVDAVVNYLHSLGPSENLSLKSLSLKLVVLMALASANRSSDLHALDLNFRRYTPEGVIFILPTLTKTRRSGPPKESFYCKFKDEVLCPVHTLQIYEKCTANLRTKNSNENRLFISYQKPHKPICSSSIARWMKTVLASAGVVTDQFKAHSTRSAATSAAKSAGVSLRDIMTMADWSRESTFTRFYHKPVVQSEFGQAVLNKHTSSW